jgi:methylmalonyl-CoA mutase
MSWPNLFLLLQKQLSSVFVKIYLFWYWKSIERAQDSLSRGADSLRFTIENESIDVTNLLENYREKVTIYFNLGLFQSISLKNRFAKKKQHHYFL